MTLTTKDTKFTKIVWSLGAGATIGHRKTQAAHSQQNCIASYTFFVFIVIFGVG